MSLREYLETVLAEYPKAVNEEYKNHTLAHLIRHEIPNYLRTVIDDPDRYKFQGSAGQGGWVKAPWVAAFDVLITTSAQSGYYPVYLFCEDFTGIYWGLNQGVTEAKEHYRSDAKTALAAKAADYRAQVHGLIKNYPALEIDLRASDATNLSSYYEAGNICAKFYLANALPTEMALVKDFREIMQIYNYMSYNETNPFVYSQIDDEGELYLEDLQNYRQHLRIERNAKLAQAAKRKQGHICKVCDLDFEKEYGVIGRGYIEAHHLTPLAQLKGQKLQLDPKKDFTVLCANCHRMIHRSPFISDVEGFRAYYKKFHS